MWYEMKDFHDANDTENQEFNLRRNILLRWKRGCDFLRDPDRGRHGIQTRQNIPCELVELASVYKLTQTLMMWDGEASELITLQLLNVTENPYQSRNSQLFY